MPENEAKYTLLEAQRILAKRECTTFGHELLERSGDNITYEIYCERCGDKWFDIGVVNAEKAKAWAEGYTARRLTAREDANPYEAKP